MITGFIANHPSEASLVAAVCLIGGFGALAWAFCKARGSNVIKDLSPNVWWRIDLEGGKVRNILIPREKDPVAYLATWIRLNPDERPIGATNSEDGTYIDMRIAR